MSAASAAAVRSCYRDLLRAVKQLPRETQSYYYKNVKQNFISHEDESDAERVQVMLSRAMADKDWVLQKVCYLPIILPGKEARAVLPAKTAKQTAKPTKSPGHSLVAQYAATVMSLIAFMVVSSLLIIVNKQVLVDDGFRYPFALTCIGQFVSALSVVPLILTGVVKVKPPPSLKDLRNRVLPTAVCSAVTMFTGNIAYLYLSVAFIQILKAFTPAMTLALLVSMGQEVMSASVLLSVLMIAVGTGGSAFIESSTPAFHLFGFLSFMVSSASEAGRVVLFQISMGKMNYSAFETLAYLSPVTGAILFVLSALLEGEAMMAPGGGFDKILAKPGLYAAATGMSVLVNLTTFIAIRQSSSLTFKVVGCVKNAAVVVVGVMFMGERLSVLQGIGYAVSIAGFMLYTMLKLQQPPPEVVTKKAH